MATYNPFTTIQVKAPNTNQFDLSFDNKLTLDMGKLVPVLCQETLPGDHFSITPEMLLRFAPLIRPIMHPINSFIHLFYVPKRIVWKKFDDFISGNDPAVAPIYFQGDVANPLNVQAGSIFDYFGLPISTNLTEKIDATPFMAYLKIFNEYFQDQNNDTDYNTLKETLSEIENSNGIILPADLDITAYSDFPIFNRAWEHDYFTSALPFAQKGDAVNIPLQLVQLIGDTETTLAKQTDGDPSPTGHIYSNSGTLAVDLGGGGLDELTVLHGITTIDGAGAELAGTINQLRVAMQLQKFLEKAARSGTRYNEFIKAQWNVNIGDDRISRPEYIGCIKNNVVIQEVLQTSQTSGDSALGDYGGHATSVVRGNTLKYFCPENGWIIGILSVMPRTAYFQGIPKKFSRMEQLDYPFPDFAHIGEQAVLNKEIYYSNADSTEINNATFGYEPQFSDLKYNAGEVHGDFRTNMKDWHLAFDFATRPVLNEEFINASPSKRIFAVVEEGVHSLYAHVYFKIDAKRRIPFYTNPSGI